MDNPELTLRYARAEQRQEKKKEKKLTGHFYTLIIVGSSVKSGFICGGGLTADGDYAEFLGGEV